MNINNCCISIFIGIITYFLLYFNKLQNLNNNVDSDKDNLKCLSNYNISLKVPLVISLVVLLILNNLNNTNCYLKDLNNSEQVIDKNNLDILITDNIMSQFL